jgi:hypothetical protein
VSSFFPTPQRPTGVIRTLPYFGSSDDKHGREAMKRAYARMMHSFRSLESGAIECVYIAFPQKPTIEILHCYLIVGGKVRVRANISHWIPGDQMGEVECWDDSTRNAKWWTALTAPVSWPDEDVLRRGFQGFRYTEELW